MREGPGRGEGNLCRSKEGGGEDRSQTRAGLGEKGCGLLSPGPEDICGEPRSSPTASARSRPRRAVAKRLPCPAGLVARASILGPRAPRPRKGLRVGHSLPVWGLRRQRWRRRRRQRVGVENGAGAAARACPRGAAEGLRLASLVPRAPRARALYTHEVSGPEGSLARGREAAVGAAAGPPRAAGRR